jgi:hypothetical protein
MYSESAQFCLGGSDNHVTERDCVERQQPQKVVGFHEDRDRSLNDTPNDSESAAKEQRRRGEAQPTTVQGAAHT